jgi:tRNA A-37 threonylcarbamoyl transferase component Bud32
MLFALLNTGRICSQADYEFGNINLLWKKNIGTSSPVCFGEKFTLGLEQKSFIITEELPGICLKDFIAQNWLALPQSEKELLIASLAQFIRKIHKSKISLPDLYIWHLFINEDKTAEGLGKYDFAVIDLNRMKRNCQNNGERIKNLGRLYYSMTNKYFDEQICEHLIRSYFSGVSDQRFKKFFRSVKKYAKKIAARRHHQPVY